MSVHADATGTTDAGNSRRPWIRRARGGPTISFAPRTHNELASDWRPRNTWLFAVTVLEWY
jgi:hypothetical protein